MKVVKATGRLETNERGSLFLPFGLVHKYQRAVSSGNWEFREDANAGILYLDNGVRKLQIYPAYSKKVNSTGAKNDLIFCIVNSEQDRRACLELILKEHYLTTPTRGVFFALKDKEKVVACCVLDDLKFGNPKGRFKIDEGLATSMGLSLETWGKGFSDGELRERQREYIDKLGVIWVSRIARDSSYRGRGLGELVVEETIKAVPAVFPDSYGYIEVIRTLPSKSKKIDFLEKAGFSRFPLARNKLLRYLGSTNQLYPSRERCDRVYYWKRLPSKSSFEVDRLFVPLSSEPFDWFVSGEKTWELRRHGRQFTRDHVYRGRYVELRRGYNSNDSLVGTINSVVESSSLREIFEAVGKIEFEKGYRAIIPNARSLEEACAKAEEILKPKPGEKFIAFNVVENVNVRFS